MSLFLFVIFMRKHTTRAGVKRSVYFWIKGGKRLIFSVISNCVKYRKRKRNLGFQKIANLPKEHVYLCPPFTNVGMYYFDHQAVVRRHTRSVLGRFFWEPFCIVEFQKLSSSSFTNTFRRFIAIRGIGQISEQICLLFSLIYFKL